MRVSSSTRRRQLNLVWPMLALMVFSSLMVMAQHDMKKMPSQKPTKSTASPTPSPSPSMSTHSKHSMPATTPPLSPTPSPETQMDTPHVQMPVPSPSASREMKPEMKMETPHVHPAAPTSTPSASPQHDMDMPNAAVSPSPSTAHDMNSMSTTSLMVMNGSEMGIRVGSSQTNILSMGQMGSGTSWQPSSGPMYMYHKVSSGWLLVFHYNFVVGINSQGGPRGTTTAESANWFMPMAYHKLGNGTLQLRGMISLEPFTFPPGGSPLLFQTSETYKSKPIIDRQHPHDLFMELSAQYTLPLGERGTWFTYFGYPGEPALGPVAFPHRLSASENPSATLGHHLQDSTHISFGVFTTGFTYRWFKFEGSIFNGREPDQNRYDFDSHKWNSRAVRLSIAPNRNWSLQLSHGFLRSPEAQEPSTDIRRTTASLQYNQPLKRGNWATAFVWGRNHTSDAGEIHNLNGYTFESTV